MASAPAPAPLASAVAPASGPATGASAVLSAVQFAVNSYFRGEHRDAESLMALPALQPAVRALREELFNAWLDAEQKKLSRARDRRDRLRREKERARARAGAAGVHGKYGGEGDKEKEDAEEEGEGDEDLAMFADSGLILSREQRARARSVLSTCALPRVMVSCVLEEAKPKEERVFSSVALNVAQVGVSFVDATPAELLFFSIENVSLEMTDSLAQQTIELTVDHLQLDNQRADLVYPNSVVLAPKQVYAASPPSSLAQSDEKDTGGAATAAGANAAGAAEGAAPARQPFVQVSVNKTHTPPGYPCQAFKYFTLLVQEFDVRVEEALIWQLLAFVNELSPAGADSSATELQAARDVQRDIALVFDAPPASASAARFYFSLLHIQPLKINLSFHASPGLRNKYDSLEFNPLQSLVNMASGYARRGRITELAV